MNGPFAKLLADDGEPTPTLTRLWWALGWALIIFILYSTLAPSRYVPDLHVNDKLEHAGAFFGMTCWFGGLVRRRRYLVLACCMVVLGGSIEILQGVMGLGRDCDFWDFAADSVGVAAALTLVYIGLGTWTSRLERLLGIA
jgi:VanZ family protein